jgi:hypothetical protein
MSVLMAVFGRWSRPEDALGALDQAPRTPEMPDSSDISALVTSSARFQNRL